MMLNKREEQISKIIEDGNNWNSKFEIISPTSELKDEKHTLKGIMFMILASLSFGLMGFSIKLTYIE